MNVVKYNVGMVFTKGDLGEVRDIIVKNKVCCAAKAGQIAPIDVIIRKGKTGLEPTQTSFLQTLNIASKINKGTIEILNDVKIITKGAKVGSSEATLLSKLKITPFFFEMRPVHIFEGGQLFGIEILEMKESKLIEGLGEGYMKVTAFCMGLEMGCGGGIPYYLKDGFRNVCGVSEGMGFSFPLQMKFVNVMGLVDGVVEGEKKEDKKEEELELEKTKEEEEKEEMEKEKEGEVFPLGGEIDLGGLFDF
jgi:large subunit ribosomal protein LP0